MGSITVINIMMLLHNKIVRYRRKNIPKRTHRALGMSENPSRINSVYVVLNFSVLVCSSSVNTANSGWLIDSKLNCSVLQNYLDEARLQKQYL